MGTKEVIKSGAKFGRLMFICNTKSINKRTFVWCICDCGTLKKIRKDHLLNNSIVSCGCYHREISSTHKMTNSLTMMSYIAMKSRCYNTNTKDYIYYGGRGIKVCDRWLESFENFYEDIGERVNKGMTLDRINVNGDYCKDNCKWSDRQTQANNRRNNRFITFNGETLSYAQWAKKIGGDINLIYQRIKRGWSEEKAVSTQVKNMKKR